MSGKPAIWVPAPGPIEARLNAAREATARAAARALARDKRKRPVLPSPPKLRPWRGGPGYGTTRWREALGDMPVTFERLREYLATTWFLTYGEIVLLIQGYASTFRWAEKEPTSTTRYTAALIIDKEGGELP
jgi:hypothetical protein